MQGIKISKQEILFLESYYQPHIKLFPFWKYYITHQIFLFGHLPLWPGHMTSTISPVTHIFSFCLIGNPGVPNGLVLVSPKSV